MRMCRNPFPQVAIPQRESLIYDPNGEIAYLVKYIENTINSNKTAVISIVGGYGLGKTHILKYLNFVARNKGYLSVFITSPGKSFLKIYRSIAQEYVKLNHNPIKLNDPYLHKAIKEITSNGKNSSIAINWVLGFRISSKLREKLGLAFNIDEEKGLEYSRILLESLAQLYRGIVLLIDELEHLLALPVSQRTKYLNYLRELIDNLPSRTMLAIALTPAFWDEIYTINPALARRLSSYILYLRNLKRTEVKAFLDLYVKAVSFDLTVTDFIQEEVLEYLYELSNGNPGEILKLASILVENALIQNIYPVNLSYAKSILANYV